MTTLHDLANLGQSVWLDYIRRGFIITGEMQTALDQGVRGVTSNPSIFEQAIAGSSDYDYPMEQLVAEDKSIDEIYEGLVLADIEQAADLLRPLYNETQGGDGYISLEVSPTLAHNTDGTINEAKRLFAAINRPNVMIKIPATPEGIPAIEAVIAEGIHVNVTLIFSVAQYEAVVGAYIAGLEKLQEAGGDLSELASVASFFVSRVDGAVDKELEAVGNTDLQGKIAVDNAKVAYARFKELFSGDRWDKLAAAGANVQRPLWASTSVKNPQYSDTLYVDTLIGPHTVNTMPTNTLNATLDHATVATTIEDGLDEARARLAQLADLGIDLDKITDDLQTDGVAKFAQSFESLMASIAEKRDRMKSDWEYMTASLGSMDVVMQVGSTLNTIKDERIMTRIWAHDHTVWKPDPTEITNRLGWLHITEAMQESRPRMESLANDVRNEGYTHALLMGMGGSSLAPEVFSKTYGTAEGYLELLVLDSTDPGAVLTNAEKLDPAKTLFIVSTKSGGTVETLSFFKYFYNRTVDVVGEADAGAHFVAITDPGSKLVGIAEQYKFRTTFINDSTIGGRYSALSYFGLVPAALLGVDLEALLSRAAVMAINAEECNCLVEGDNNSARLGVIMAELAKVGQDKVTLVASPQIASFGDWVEQLVAESTGKEGHGILPVVGEPLGPPDVYKRDRLFAYMRLESDNNSNLDEAIAALAEAGHPVVTLHLKDLYDLGGQFFLWEMATAVAGALIHINPFDQPNVEDAKILAREMVSAYQDEGTLPELTPALQSNGTTVYGDITADSPVDALQKFLAQAESGAYVSLQAYVEPSPDTDEALTALRAVLRDKTNLAVTVGYGPRFLHSTGQLHKGDAGKGLFIQFTAADDRDTDIPDEAGTSDSTMSFGVLKAAQALGDRQALLDNGRKVIRFHFAGDVAAALKGLSESL